jgi:hypothetical protein
MIGDSAVDVELAQRGGCRGAVLLHVSGEEPSNKLRPLVYSAADFEEAVEIVLRVDQRAP